MAKQASVEESASLGDFDSSLGLAQGNSQSIGLESVPNETILEESSEAGSNESDSESDQGSSTEERIKIVVEGEA